jgi:D-glycero-D-manno-heptose 1,7-bisphosphate phosphatase
MKRPAVFLDRDGVLNEIVVRGNRPGSPRKMEEFRFLPGVERACEALREGGFFLACVTNQPEISRRTLEPRQLEAMMETVRRHLALDDVGVCTHDDADGCACRKPKPGLILAAAGRFDLDLERSIMVGDRWRDMEAGKSAGCRTVFVRNGLGEEPPAWVDFACADLSEAAAWILGWDI